MRWHAPTIVIAMPGQRDVAGPLRVDVHAVGRRRTRTPANDTSATCSTGSNTGAAPDGHLAGVDEEHPGVGDDREPLGAVAVEDVARGSVEHPAVGVAVRR